jgi:hypothetical protein
VFEKKMLFGKCCLDKDKDKDKDKEVMFVL